MAEITSKVADLELHVQPDGDGGSAVTTTREVETIGPSILPYLKAIADGSRPLDDSQSQELTGANPGPPGSKVGLKALLDYISSSSGNAIAPPPPTDLNRPLPEYFISSSHNTYLTGNQLYSDASTDAYKNVLLRGCRCIEIDVWDGEDSSSSESEDDDPKTTEKRSIRSRLTDALRERKKHSKRAKDSNKHDPDAKEFTHSSGTGGHSEVKRVEPRVLHGHTFTKEVSFREVCTTIKDAAFVNSDLPLIVSLEVHAGETQQKQMIDIMNESWGSLLVNPSAEEPNTLPTPAELKHKILIKVKAAPKSDASNDAPAAAKEAELNTSSSDSGIAESPAKSKKPKKKKSKVIDGLSSLGIYTRGYRFSKLDTPEAVIPAHVFSLSEKKMVQVHEYFGPALFSHNMKYFMRAYPSGTRVSSSNLDPSIFWRKFGVQMVALNWQHIDAGVMLNEGQFAGSGGWVLKPEGYRERPVSGGDASVAMPQVKISQSFNLHIEVLAAQDLPLKGDTKADRLHPFIKCQLHVGSPQERIGSDKDGSVKNQDKHKRRTKGGKGTDPDFGRELLQFPNISTVEALSFVRRSRHSPCVTATKDKVSYGSEFPIRSGTQCEFGGERNAKARLSQFASVAGTPAGTDFPDATTTVVQLQRIGTGKVGRGLLKRESARQILSLATSPRTELAFAAATERIEAASTGGPNRICSCEHAMKGRY